MGPRPQELGLAAEAHPTILSSHTPLLCGSGVEAREEALAMGSFCVSSAVEGLQGGRSQP